jgi:hypothetical protein
MNPDSMQFYLSLSTGFYLLAMVAEVVGCFLCLSFRHLSGWTILVAIGFAGLFTAGVVARLLSQRWLFGDLAQGLMGLVLVVGGGLFFLSMIAVVGGLWMTFLEVQRRLAMALEPKDGWR